MRRTMNTLRRLPGEYKVSGCICNGQVAQVLLFEPGGVDDLQLVPKYRHYIHE